MAGEGSTGFAIVEEKGTRKQRLVKAGDVIAGAKVVRIKRNAVDVLVEDQERTLKIAETKEAPILPPPAGRRPYSLRQPRRPAPLPSAEARSGRDCRTWGACSARPRSGPTSMRAYRMDS